MPPPPSEVYRPYFSAPVTALRPFPASRYCVRTKGKRADLDQPGACGKGQVYLEGAVDILRAVDNIDFHLLYSGRVSNRSRMMFRPKRSLNRICVGSRCASVEKNASKNLNPEQ